MCKVKHICTLVRGVNNNCKNYEQPSDFSGDLPWEGCIDLNGQKRAI